MNELRTFEAEVRTDEAVPPPYKMRYQLSGTLTDDGLEVSYERHYLDRDELSEEEILEEGFTLDDDFAWSGVLPAVWNDELRRRWQQTTTLRPADAATLRLSVRTADGTLARGVPSDPPVWEYLLQELTQAVFEAAGHEGRLLLRYAEVLPDGQSRGWQLEPAFRDRTLRRVRTRHGQPEGEATTLPWAALKPLLKQLYLPDYNPEAAHDALPRTPGHYVDSGDGLWYELDKGLSAPSGNPAALERLRATLRDVGQLPDTA